jgi:PHD/YefM family antitoxin component YafN of YafNO toxin-antitoxin module
MREGKPTAVILSLEEYRKLLERVEDSEDLKTLRGDEEATAKIPQTRRLPKGLRWCMRF